MTDLATTGEVSPVGDITDELLVCRLESPTAAIAVLSAAAQLVQAMPTRLAVEPLVYAGLQRLAGDVETAIFAADHVRQQGGPSDTNDPSRLA